MSAEPEPVTETWLYAGHREASTGKTINAWVQPDGTMVYYATKRGEHYSVAQPYAVQVERTDGKTMMIGRPIYMSASDADRQATEDERIEWGAKHRAHDYAQTQAVAERAAARDEDLEAAIDTLRGYHTRLRGYAEKTAFRHWIESEIMRPGARP